MYKVKPNKITFIDAYKDASTALQLLIDSIELKNKESFDLLINFIYKHLKKEIEIMHKEFLELHNYNNKEQ